MICHHSVEPLAGLPVVNRRKGGDDVNHHAYDLEAFTRAVVGTTVAVGDDETNLLNDLSSDCR